MLSALRPPIGCWCTAHVVWGARCSSLNQPHCAWSRTSWATMRIGALHRGLASQTRTTAEALCVPATGRAAADHRACVKTSVMSQNGSTPSQAGVTVGNEVKHPQSTGYGHCWGRTSTSGPAASRATQNQPCEGHSKTHEHATQGMWPWPPTVSCMLSGTRTAPGSELLAPSQGVAAASATWPAWMVQGQAELGLAEVG